MVLATALVLVALVWLPAQDVVFGGRTDARMLLVGGSPVTGLVQPVVTTSFSPRLSVYGSTAELQIDGTISHQLPATIAGVPLEWAGQTPLSVSLSQLQLTFYPAPWLVLDVGRFVHAPGRALVLSPVNYFAGYDLDALAGGASTGVQTPATLLQARAFFGSGYAVATVAPVPQTASLPSITAAWVDRLPLPATIDDLAVSQDPVMLDDVTLFQTAALEDPLSRVSTSIQVGATVGPFDLSAFYYHGIDPMPITRAAVVYDGSDPPATFDLWIVPEEATLDSMGVSAEAAFGSATVWTDLGLDLNKHLATNRVDLQARTTDVVETPLFSGVVGASYQIYPPNLLLLAEFRQAYPFSDDPDLLGVGLSSLGTLLARLVPADGPVTISAGGVIDLADARRLGGAMFGSVEYSPSAELTVSAQAPLFWGAHNTVFGGLSEFFGGMLGLTYRF